jgi:addiction module HigA family antidote
MFMRAVHPGVVLKDELEELGVTPTEFARQIDVPANRVSQIIAGKRSITGDTALRFGHWFGTEPQFWLNLQSQFELALADKETGETIRHLPTRKTAAPPPDQPSLI